MTDKMRAIMEAAGGGFIMADGMKRVAGDTFKIPVGLVDPDPENARRSFDEQELASLAEQLRRVGQLQNAVVFPVAGRYQLVAGERRLRACKLAGIPTLTCLVLPRDVAVEVRQEMAFAENMARANLKPTEVARHWKMLMERWNVTGVELARRVGVSQSSVSKKLALLKLDADTQRQVDAGTVGEELARRTSAPRVRPPRRGRRNDRNVAELPAGTVRLKRGRSWGELLEQLRRHVEGDGRADAA